MNATTGLHPRPSGHVFKVWVMDPRMLAKPSRHQSPQSLAP